MRRPLNKHIQYSTILRYFTINMWLNTIHYFYTTLIISNAKHVCVHCIFYNVILQKLLQYSKYSYVQLVGPPQTINLFYFCQVINFAKNKQNFCASLTPIFTPCQSAFSLDLLLSTGKRLIGKHFMIFYGPFYSKCFLTNFPFSHIYYDIDIFDSRIFCIYFY